MGTLEYAYCVGGYQWFWGRFWLHILPAVGCSNVNGLYFPQCWPGTDVGSRLGFRMCNRSRKVHFSLQCLLKCGSSDLRAGFCLSVCFRVVQCEKTTEQMATVIFVTLLAVNVKFTAVYRVMPCGLLDTYVV